MEKKKYNCQRVRRKRENTTRESLKGWEGEREKGRKGEQEEAMRADDEGSGSTVEIGRRELGKRRREKRREQRRETREGVGTLPLRGMEGLSVWTRTARITFTRLRIAL